MKFAVAAAVVAMCATVAFGEIVLNPPKMPCAFTINIASSIHFHNDTFEHWINDTSVAFFDGTMTGKNSFLAGVEFDQIVYRTDLSIKNETDNKTYFTKYTAYRDPSLPNRTQCTKEYLTREQMEGELIAEFAGFLEKHTCQTLVNTTFDGESCRLCYTVESGYPQHLYINDDGMVISSDISFVHPFYHMNYSSQFNFTYELKEPDLSVFVIDKKMVPDCEEKAYTVPKSLCYGVASTTKASFVIVLAAVVVALIKY